MDDVTQIVERLRNRIHDSPMPAERLMDESADTITALAERVKELEAENAALRHWAFNHVDALLLYTTYPNDTDVKDAVEFCKIIEPKRKLRMAHLAGSGYHIARKALEQQP